MLKILCENKVFLYKEAINQNFTFFLNIKIILRKKKELYLKPIFFVKKNWHHFKKNLINMCSLYYYY